MLVSAFRDQFLSIKDTFSHTVATLTTIGDEPEEQQIAESCPELTKALQSRESLVINTNGTWRKNRWIVALFRKIIGEDEAVLSARQLAKYLGKPHLVKSSDFQGLSSDPALSSDQIDGLVDAVRNSLLAQTTQEEILLEEKKSDREVLKSSGNLTKAELVESSRRNFDKNNFPARFALAEVERAQIASYYLGKSQEEIGNKSVQPQDPDWMETRLKEWQERTFPVTDFVKEPETASYKEPVNFLSDPYIEGTKAKINRCCKYKKFIDAARDNPLLLDFFFHAVFRNAPKDSTEAVDIFMQAPSIQSELHRCYLDVRVQNIASKGLKIEEHIDSKTKKIIKDISLLINGSHQSIVDPSRLVTVSNKTSMTVKNLFETFKKGLDYGFIRYEYLQDTGISEFDGRCKDIDLEKKDWWKDIPVVERLTRSEISKRYGVDFSKGFSLLVLRASRKFPDLHARDTHSWMDILIPLEDGTFNVISVGKFPKSFPVGTLQELEHIFKAHPAELSVIDPNKFYSWRERVHFPFPPMDEKTFLRLMEKIRKDFIRCREGKDYFQMQGKENCSGWVEETIKYIYPKFTLDLFNTMVNELVLPSFISYFHSWRPSQILLGLLLGAWRGAEFEGDDGKKKMVRLLFHLDWLKGIFHIPARICEADRAREIQDAIKLLSTAA